MTVEPVGQVTRLLLRWNAGEQACLDELIPLVEHDLRRMAHAHMRREREGHTLQTTALMNEAYLKLVDQSRVKWENKAQFLAVMAIAMRRILVDHARGICRKKRGGLTQQIPLDEGFIFAPAKSAALIALNDLLEELAVVDPRLAKTVEMRWFGGLSVEECAQALHVHPNTVIRDWSLARAWLKHEMERRGAHAG